MKRALVFLLFTLFVTESFCGEYAVIANKRNDKALDKETIKAIYLKKIRKSGSLKLVPVNLPAKNKVRKSFEKNVLEMTQEELKAYWKKQHYLGIRPPLVLSSPQSVKLFVKKVPGALGYIEAEDVDANISTVYVWNKPKPPSPPPVVLSQEKPKRAQYVLGEGFAIGSLPVYVGGYFSVNYLHSNSVDEFKLDDFAVLSYGNYKKLSYMLELEFKDPYVIRNDANSTTTTTNTKLYFERAYIEYAFSDELMARLGRFNNPIGYWNLIPINVLRETTSNPVLTQVVFPRFTTGINAQYTYFSTYETAVDLIVQHNQTISDDYNNYRTDEHYGAGLTFERENLSLKLSAGKFQKDASYNIYEEDFYYGLVAAKYETEKLEVLFEAGTQYNATQNEYTTRYAAYVQGAYRFTPKHIGVLRLESYDTQSIYTTNTKAIFGYTYRPLYPVAFKGEYQLNSDSDRNLVLFSFSVLF